MAYAQDTLTSANAANDLVAVIDGLLTTAGWETVETLTPSGTYRNRIYKSPSASNLCGYDWYLAVCWNTVGTEQYVRIFGFESWNTGTKLASGISGAESSASTNQAMTSQPVTGYTTSNTVNLGTLAVTNSATTIQVGSSYVVNSNQQFGWQTLVPSSAFAYWASVTLDHVALWTTVSSNVSHAVIGSLIIDADYETSGLFNPTPVVTVRNSGVGLSSHFYGVALSGAPTYLAAGWRLTGTFGSKLPLLSDSYFPAYAQRPYLYLHFMTQGAGNPTPNTSLLGEVIVGRIPDYYFVWGGSIGDTVEIDSATYVLSPELISSGPYGATAAVLVE